MDTAQQPIPHVITHDDIRRAFRFGDEAKREICEKVAENLAASNASQAFRFNSAGVYVIDGARVVLVYSWTILGAFIQCAPALDVSAYVDRGTLCEPSRNGSRFSRVSSV